MNFLQLSGYLSLCKNFIFLVLLHYRYTWSISIKLDTTILAGIHDFDLKEYEKYFDDTRKPFFPEPLDQYPNLAKTTYVKEHASWVNDGSCLFSSPELKAQVSFSDHL